MKILKYACQELGLPYQVVHDRVQKGWITTIHIGKYHMVDPAVLQREMDMIGYTARKAKKNEVH